MTTPLSCELLARPMLKEPHTRIVRVRDESGDVVTVHWHYRRSPHQPEFRFACSACGRCEQAHGCVHVFSAALTLAGDLLGLEQA